MQPPSLAYSHSQFEATSLGPQPSGFSPQASGCVLGNHGKLARCYRDGGILYCIELTHLRRSNVEHQTLASVNTISVVLLCTCTSVMQLMLLFPLTPQVDVPISRSTLSAGRRSHLTAGTRSRTLDTVFFTHWLAMVNPSLTDSA